MGGVVTGARQHVSDVLVVDDGSGDDTAVQARGAGAAVVTHPQRRGKGVALLTGMRALHAAGVSHALTMDGDGQHLPSQIPALLQALADSPEALILGARRMDRVEAAPLRLFGNRFANRWVEIACGQAIPDTQSGFRVYPLAAVLRLPLRAHHFAFETEVLIRAVRAGIRIESVPVDVYYPPPAEHASHFRPVVDTLRMIVVVLGLIFRLW
ncbi:glycosyltransferase family 2 protein [Candidatus Binatia bacterium]|nr:glycosyltransferase family 2 protein [Candidatus Binatia bacterium]